MNAEVQIEKKGKVGDFLASYWGGKQPLWKAYWILLLLQLGIQTILAFFLRTISVPYDRAITIAMIVIVPMLTFWAVSVWRCASHSRLVWKILGRIGAVILCFYVLAMIVELVRKSLGTIELCFQPDVVIRRTVS